MRKTKVRGRRVQKRETRKWGNEAAQCHHYTPARHHSIRSVMPRKPGFTRQHRGRLCLDVGQGELTCTRETVMKAWLHCSCPTLQYTPYKWREGWSGKSEWGRGDSDWQQMNKISVCWDPAKADQCSIGRHFTLDRKLNWENATLANGTNTFYIYTVCCWMSHLLNCLSHLKSTAKTWRWTESTVVFEVRTHQWCKVASDTFSGSQCFPWRAHRAIVKNIFPIQCHPMKGSRLWHCVSVCFHQQLSSLREVVLRFYSFLATLAYWALKLLSHPFPCQPPSTLRFYLSYNNPPLALLSSAVIWRQFSPSLSRVCVELISPHSQPSFPHLG